MKVGLWTFLGLLLLLSGCAPATYQPYQPGYEPGDSYPGRVPGWWYDNDPSMRYWFTPPYFNPEAP